MALPEVESRSIQFLSWMTAVAVGSYLIFYVLTPWAYDTGPAFLLVLACLSLGFQWPILRKRLDRQTLWFLAALVGYFLLQVLILLVHGEDVSDFDLAFRYVAAGLVLLFLLVNPVNAAQLFFFAGMGGVLTGGYALYFALFQEAPRLKSFDNPIHFGNGALALACLSFAGLMWSLKARLGVILAALMVLGIIGGVLASLLSETRSGWVAFPVLVGLLFVIYRHHLTSGWRWVPWLILVVVVLPACFAQVDMVEKRMLTAGEQVIQYFEKGANGTSVGLRLDMYKVGLLAFSENPLVGIGPTEVESKVEELVKSGEVHPLVANYRHLHNQYIDNMARSGIVGLTAYLLLLLIPFCLFLAKTRSPLPSVKALGVGGVLFVGLHGVVNLTQSMLERNIGVMMFVFVMVFLWAALKREERVAGCTPPTP